MPVYAEEDGYIAALPAMEHGLLLCVWGLEDCQSDDSDYETGITLAKKSDPVQKGDLVVTIYKFRNLSKKHCRIPKKNVKMARQGCKRFRNY